MECCICYKSFSGKEMTESVYPRYRTCLTCNEGVMCRKCGTKHVFPDGDEDITPVYKCKCPICRQIQYKWVLDDCIRLMLDLLYFKTPYEELNDAGRVYYRNASLWDEDLDY